MFRKNNFFLYIVVLFLFGAVNEKPYCQDYSQQPKLNNSESSQDFDHGIFDFGYIFSSTDDSPYNDKMKYGFNFGLAIDFVNIDDSLIFSARGDFAVSKWSSGRVPLIIYLGLRLYLPFTDFIRIYGEAGPECRFETNTPGKDKIGLAFGGGIDFLIPLGEYINKLVLGFNFRYHYKYYDAMSFTPYIGLSF